jgi:hypothetical protein
MAPQKRTVSLLAATMFPPQINSFLQHREVTFRQINRENSYGMASWLGHDSRFSHDMG